MILFVCVEYIRTPPFFILADSGDLFFLFGRELFDLWKSCTNIDIKASLSLNLAQLFHFKRNNIKISCFLSQGPVITRGFDNEFVNPGLHSDPSSSAGKTWWQLSQGEGRIWRYYMMDTIYDGYNLVSLSRILKENALYCLLQVLRMVEWSTSFEQRTQEEEGTRKRCLFSCPQMSSQSCSHLKHTTLHCPLKAKSLLTAVNTYYVYLT